MSLEILCGRSKSGKSEYIYKQIASLVSEGKEVMLIVPEQFSHSAERNLLKYVNAIKDNEVEVFSFNHLASVTENRLGINNAPLINSVGKAIIIKEILKDNEFAFYKGMSSQNGFVDLVCTLISEFKKYMILPETLSGIADETEDVILAMKLSDLKKIYSQYEEKLSLKYRDGDDALSLLSKQLSQSSIYDKKYVFFDGFSTFVPQEYDIIGRFCNRCAGVTVSLSYDPNETNTTLFMPTYTTLNKLSALSEHKVKITHLSESYFSSEELKFLEKNLYSFSKAVYEKYCSNIKVFGLQNPLAEIEMCACEIKNLVREQGYMYRDIGILCSDVEAYTRHIDRVFPRCDIEYFTDNKNDIINHHLIRFVLGILEVYINDYAYSELFNYLKACFVTADPTSVAILDRFIQKTKIRRSTWLDDEKWSCILQANFNDDKYAQNSLNRIRDKYILPLAMLHENLKGRHRVRDVAEKLYNFLVQLNMPETISGYIDHFNEIGEIRLSKEYEKLWDIIVSSLDELVQICGDRKVSTEGFYELLTTAFEQHSVGFLPTGVDRIQIGNAERTRFENIKVLFVLGVNEGLFPVAKKPDGVLGDNDKNAMKNCGCDFSTTSEIAAYYSQFAAYCGLTIPSEKLYISYSKSDNDFKTLRKSYIVNKILNMFSIKEQSEASYDNLYKIIGLNYTKSDLAVNYARFIKNNDVDPVWGAVYSYYENNTDFAEKLTKFTKADNYFHSLSSENLKALIPMLSNTSVSKLERYMACKYAYFIDYILRPEMLKEETVDAIDIGNLTHGILEKLCREYGSSTETFKNTSDETIIAKIDDYIDEYISVISGTTDDISMRDKYILSRLKNSILLCYNIVKQQFVNSGFEPLGYEIAFNDNSPLGSIEIETDNNNHIKLTGIIDRADILTGDNFSYVRVIDYKTGYKEFRLDDVMYGLSLQLMVYLNKLVSTDSNYTYGGAWYFPVSDIIFKSDRPMDAHEAQTAITDEFKLKGIVPFDDDVLKGYDEKVVKSLSRSHKNKRLSVDDFAVMDRFIKKKLGDICDDIINGKFDIAPCKKSNFTPCEYCKYNNICRFDALTNEYQNYKSVNGYDEIIAEMEAEISEQSEDKLD